MIKNAGLFFALLGFVVCASCIIPDARRERAEIELQRNDSLIVVEEGDFRFTIILPKDLIITNQPSIELSADGNALSIQCGSEFQLVVSIEPSEKMAANDEPIFEGILRCQSLDNEDNCKVYKRILPDSRVYDYGIRQFATIDGHTYAFKSATEGEFNLDAVLRMKLALASLKM